MIIICSDLQIQVITTSIPWSPGIYRWRSRWEVGHDFDRCIISIDVTISIKHVLYGYPRSFVQYYRPFLLLQTCVGNGRQQTYYIGNGRRQFPKNAMPLLAYVVN